MEAIKSRELRERYGNEVVLLDDQEESVVFRILEELKLGSRYYAVLQNEKDRKDDLISLFRVTWEQGNPQLETIEDEEEWEQVAELYDDTRFPEDEI